MKKIYIKKLLEYNGDQFITEVYRNILRRNPDPNGFSYFKKLLTNGTSKEFILYSIITSDEANKINLKLIGLEKIKKNLSEYHIKEGKKSLMSSFKMWLSDFIKLPNKIANLSDELKKQELIIDKINSNYKKNLVIPAANNIVLANIQGFIMGLPAEDLSVLAQMIYYENLEQGLESAFKKYVKKNMTVIDIGAHVGLYTLLAARAIGNGGKIYSFEPTLKIFNLLKQNVNINFFVHSNKIICEQLAVTNKKGRVKFFISQQKTGHNSLYSVEPKNEFISVETVSLDEYLKPNEKVDIVKIDAEGSEPLIIKGMRNIIKNNPNIIIFMEFCPSNLRRAGVSPIDFIKSLKKLDLKIRIVDDFTGELMNLTEKKLINCFSENLMLTKN